MKRTHSGAASGKGAVYEWDGNKEIGKGRMEMIESVPPSTITINTDFIKPFAAQEHRGVHLAGRWRLDAGHAGDFRPEPIYLKVDWPCVQHGQDDQRKFEQGLAELKALAERSQEDSNARPVDGLCGSEKLRPAFAWSLCNSKLMRFNVTRMVYGLKVLVDV